MNLFSIIFIWVEFFQFSNRNRLNDLYFQKFSPLKWIIFYTSKIFYFIWIILQLFTDQYLLVVILIILHLLRYRILKLNSVYINTYDLFNLIISIAILLRFTYLGVAQLL
jgi:hypothetical protein